LYLGNFEQCLEVAEISAVWRALTMVQPWDFMEFYGILWNFVGFLWEFYGILWDFYGNFMGV